LQALGGRETFQLVADGHAADRLVEQRQDRLLALAAIELDEQRLDRADR
jgi:hypothetical protein